MKDTNNYLKLVFCPSLEIIDGIRVFLEGFAFSSIKNSDLAKATALTASELLENAVKYSSGDRIHLEVDLFPDSKLTEGITVTVENFTKESNVQKLRRILDEITKTSPREAYLNKLKKAMERGMKSTVSELGLARIQYEAYARCSLTLGDDNFVSVSAKIMKDST